MDNLSEKINNYLWYCENQKRLDWKTIKAYRCDLHQYHEFTILHNYEVTREVIEKYIAWLHNKFQPKTAKRKIACIKAFFVHLESISEGYVNPMQRIRTKFREPFVLPRTIPLSTIQRIIQMAYVVIQEDELSQQQYLIALRDVAVLELLFALGARVSEICSLKRENIDLESGIVNIFGKGSKERLLQVGNLDALKLLRLYDKLVNIKDEATPYFFINRFGNRLSEQSVRSIINKYAAKCGVQGHITPHMFRHTFATLLLEEDVDIRYIQQLLGHSSITTTQIYTHVTIEKQKQILIAKHPRNRIHATLDNL
jgi:integrase/recombinase XerD